MNTQANLTLPAPAVDVQLVGGTPKTTSLNIAEVFGKRHDNIIRDIQKLDCSEEFRLLNFEETTYLDEFGREQPMVELTKNGTAFLVMGFTGKQAARFKEAYIAEFDRLEALARAGGAAGEDWRALCQEYKALLQDERSRNGHLKNEALRQRLELLDLYRKLYGPKH